MLQLRIQNFEQDTCEEKDIMGDHQTTHLPSAYFQVDNIGRP